MPLRLVEVFSLLVRVCETHMPLRTLEVHQYHIEVLG